MINRLKLIGLISLFVLSMSQTAHAIVIETGASNGEGGYDWTVTTASWGAFGDAAVTDISGGSGTDWMVEVGASSFGASENDSQTSQISGGGTAITGVEAVRVTFDFDGFTFDSYNSDPSSTAFSVGYWDLFALNISTVGSYWDQITGGLTDPLMSTDPAGSVVIDPDGTGALDGSTWAWGGLDFASGFYEELHGTYTIQLTGDITDIFRISAVLDTSTNPNSDSSYPSWGTFNANGPVTPPGDGDPQNVPAPAGILMLALGLLGLGVGRRRQ